MLWNRPTAEAQPIQPSDGEQIGTDDPSAYFLRASATSVPFQVGVPTRRSCLLPTDVGHRVGNTSLIGQTSLAMRVNPFSGAVPVAILFAEPQNQSASFK